MSRADDWEEVEITLRQWLDDDEAVSVLQVLQACGWQSPKEVARIKSEHVREIAHEQQLRIPLPPLHPDAGLVLRLEAALVDLATVAVTVDPSIAARVALETGRVIEELCGGV